MTTILHLTWRSLLNRRAAAFLVVVSIALSVALLLGIERLRQDVRGSFARTISGIDLVVGARSSPIELLLYSVFRVGNPTNNLSWKSYQAIAKHPDVAWMVPVSLGDSHKGFRVMGTSADYFVHYRYGRWQALGFAAGKAFNDVFEAVVGAEIASTLGYKLGQKVVVTHGVSEVAIRQHDDKPFTVVGVLKPTGTPVDRTVHVSLEGIEAMHVDWRAGAPIPGFSIPADKVKKFDLTPKQITAAFVGLKSRVAVFKMQRLINEYRDEPLLAVLPGVTLQEMWRVLGLGEQALLLVSCMVVLVGIAGMVAVVLAGLGARRRELAILRALGARPAQIFLLLAAESMLLTLFGLMLGAALVVVAVAAAGPFIEARFGIALTLAQPSAIEWAMAAAVLAAGLLASVIPGYNAYRRSLADGMMVRL
jgi:putative ABC transport system permease protein